MNEYRLQLPLSDKDIESLRAGDKVLLSGSLLTGRDAAHKRLQECADAKHPFPVDIKGQILYYVGPTPAKPGHPVGSAGPTSSYRMDAYTPTLLEHGLKGMIGKGNRSAEVTEAIKKHRAVYFAAIGGLGVSIARSVIRSEVICYEDLGAEAIHRFYVKDFPVFVAIDSLGNNYYTLGRKEFLESQKNR